MINLLKNIFRKIGGFGRFISVGAINAAASYILYLLLLNFVSCSVAYIFSYISGIILSSVLNLNYVFHKNKTIKNIILISGTYTLLLLVNLTLLNYLVKQGLNPIISPLLILIFTFPLAYLSQKKILSKI